MQSSWLQKRSSDGPTAEELMEMADKIRHTRPGEAIPPFDSNRHKEVIDLADSAMQNIGNQQEMVAYLKNQISQKVDHHTRQLKIRQDENKLNDDDFRINWELQKQDRKTSKWLRKNHALMANDNGALASAIADEYHKERILAHETEERYRRKAKEEKGHWSSADHEERAHDHMIRKNKATSSWMKWRALANHKQQGNFEGSTSYGF